MSKRSKVIAGALAAAVLLAAAFGASTVLAQGRTGTQPFGCGGVGRGGMMGGYGPIMDEPTIAVVAEALGVSSESLAADLRSGKALTDIITASGKSIDDVTQFVLADRKADLDKAVADGRITQAQANTMLARIESQIATCLETGIGTGLGAGCGLRTNQSGVLGAVRGMMGKGARWGMMGRFFNKAN